MISVLIRKIMEELGLRQRDLAEVMEVPLQRIKRLAAGSAKNLTREEGERLIRKLNVRAEWLATGEGPMLQTEKGSEVQRRLDMVKDAARLAELEGLTKDERARAYMLVYGLMVKDAAMARDALAQTTEQEMALIDSYRAATDEGKKAIETTAKALAREGKNDNN